MNRREFLGAVAASGAVRPEFANAAPEAAVLRAGFAERDITPDIGMEQPGDYVKSYLERFHDPCKVRAAVIESAGAKAAIVAIDALIAPRQVVTAARQRIAKRCGIDPGSVLISATHSHSSGPVAMVQPGEYDHADSFVRKLAYDFSSCADSGYLERVEAEIVAAVCHAHSFRAPSRLSFGSGVQEHVAFNRRFRMRNGQSWTHPGPGNPDIIEPAGPVDPQVGVIGSWDNGGRLTGCIVNFTCHATTGPEAISANWVYYLEKAIRGFFGPDVVVIFLQGFAGEVTQVDNLSPYRQPSSDQYGQLIGGSVGAEALKVLLSAWPTDAATVASASRVLELRRRRPRPDRVRAARELAARSEKEIGHARWVFAKETVMLDAFVQAQPTMPAEVQAVQIGPSVLLSCPGEMFCDLGLRLKKLSKFPLTMAVELANGCAGYIQTSDAMGPRGGGYETRLTSYTNAELGAGDRMIATAIELASSMRPDKMPERPPAAPFKAPWDYGNVPPEME